MLSLVRPKALAAFVLTVALVAVIPAISSTSSAEARQFGSDKPSSLGLERAHAHNDYEHERPLYDALSHGFKSVEADIWLVDGELLVAHDQDEVQQGRTLRHLYLKPLWKLVKQNSGSVYRGDPDYFTLLIDIKSEDVPTYLALHEELRHYKQMLTKFGPHGVKDGAVTVIVSGNRPRELMEQRRVRFAGYDGRLEDLGVATDQSFIPLISDNWTETFTWTGDGPMPHEEREKLRSIVEIAHANGQRVRFWATPEERPERNAVWEELLAANVDYINTDHLRALERFLLRNDPEPTVPYVSWGDSGAAIPYERVGN